MKRTLSVSSFSDELCPVEKHFKCANVIESLWDLLPAELHARIFSYLSSSHPYHSYLLVSRGWNALFFRSVTSLNLMRYSARVDDMVMRHLSETCTQVQQLTIGKIGEEMPISELGMMCLRNFPKLQNLNLVSCTLSASSIKILAMNLPNLESLNITWCKIPNECIEMFTLFRRLRHLSLLDSKIDDKGLAKIEELRNLSSLNFSFCNSISDMGVIRLVQALKNIESLNLSWCADITDISLLHIGTQLNKLKILHLTGCRNISMDGKNFIRRNLPDCKVFADSNFNPFKNTHCIV